MKKSLKHILISRGQTSSKLHQGDRTEGYLNVIIGLIKMLFCVAPISVPRTLNMPFLVFYSCLLFVSENNYC